MASKKLLKKRVKRIVYEVLDSCDYHIVNEHPKADEADSLIDEAVDFHDGIVNKINEANSKKEFKAITEEVDKANRTFTDKLNSF